MLLSELNSTHALKIITIVKCHTGCNLEGHEGAFAIVPSNLRHNDTLYFVKPDKTVLRWEWCSDGRAANKYVEIEVFTP